MKTKNRGGDEPPQDPAAAAQSNEERILARQAAERVAKRKEIDIAIARARLRQVQAKARGDLQSAAIEIGVINRRLDERNRLGH